MNGDTIKRQTAVKMRVSDIKGSEYVKAEGEWQPNYLLTQNNLKVSRVNVIGTTIDSEDNSFTIDDGTDKVVVRSFEEMKTIPRIGEIVLLIGKPRDFNGIYIVPEIIKRIESQQKDWMELRKLELKDSGDERKKEEKESSRNNFGEEEKEAAEKQESEVTSNGSNKVFDTVMQAMRDLDEGNGADTDEIIAKTGFPEQEVENIINNLLVDGEAFEIKPGKLKLLD